MQPDVPFDFATLAKLDDKQLQQLFGVRDFFSYELSVASLAAAGSASPSFTVQVDSNFLWQAGAMTADVANTVAKQPLVTATITDSSSGRQLQSAGTPLGNIFGTAELPFLLPTPRFFRGGTQVTLSLTNYSTATTYLNIKLSFIGTKFFKFAQQI